MKINLDKNCCDHHRCHEKTCKVKTPHAHTVPGHKHDDCLTCIRDHLKINLDKNCCDHHRCHEKTCKVKTPHAHTVPGHKHDDCLTCIRDHFKGIFPLQEKISKSNLNNLAKQFLVTVGFLGTAIPVAKIASTGLKYI